MEYQIISDLPSRPPAPQLNETAEQLFSHRKRLLFSCVPGMARIQLEISQPQVVTAKCSEPQVVNSDVEDGGSGVAILSSVRTEI